MFRKMLRKIKITRPPSLAVLANWAAIILAVGMAGSLGFGLGAASNPAPKACGVGFTLAEQVFTTKENASTSLYLRATRGQSAFDQHDADVQAAWKHEAELMGVYGDAKAECLGGAR
jgi:hypothetical protein